MNYNNKFSSEKFNAAGESGLHKHLGIAILSVEEKRIVAEMSLAEIRFAANGYLHAGSIVSLADTTAGYGCVAHFPPSAKSFTTIQLKTNFLSSAQDGTLICEAVPVHLGKTTQVWDSTVKHKESGKVMALFTCTQLHIY